MAQPPSQDSGAGSIGLVAANGSSQASKPGKPQPFVSFDRQELSMLLNLYGRKVAAGEWRDYAMDMLADRAMFSIYKRSSERAQFVVEKTPRLRNRQGIYSVVNAEGRVLKRGHDLGRVIRVLDPGLAIVR